MKKTIVSMFETGMLQVLCLLVLLVCAFVFAGCSVTKVNYERDEKGVVSYRLYRNSHWLKTEGEGMRGGMTGDGKFEFDLEGMRSSPSEEFNRTMMTYTSAFIQLAQIAAAAYNPSASAAAAGNKGTTVNVLPASETNGTAGTNGTNGTNGTTASGQPAVAEAVAAEQQATGAATSQESGVSSQESGSSDPHCADGSCSPNDCPDGNCSPSVSEVK